MHKIILSLLLYCLCFTKLNAQTTDLAIVVEAQNLSDNDVSQVQIYQEFQYIVTIINSGNAVSNATFSLNMNDNIVVNTYTSQNNTGGATNAESFNLALNNVLTGSVANLPNNSSVEIKILVNAPTEIGGIAINALVSPPDGTTDTNTSNNQSIISINVVDVPIDFTVTHSQITPSPGTPINAWGDFVTYEFTITNNSSIAFPLSSFTGFLELNTPYAYGRPVVVLSSIECLGGTNGTECPDISNTSGNPIEINSIDDVFSFGTHVYTSGGSLSFRIVYQYLDPLCALVENEFINVDSFIRLTINDGDEFYYESNRVTTDLLTAELCNLTDICIETVQLNPDPSTVVNWNEDVLFETTVCNNGPLDAPIIFFLQNLSVGIQWEIVSVVCVETTGTVSCDDFTITTDEIFWSSSTFVMPANATITIQTVVRFLEPECSTNVDNAIAHIRSGTNLLAADIIDTNVENSSESDYVTLPPTDACPSSDLQVTKTQISPELPEGSNINNTTSWGAVSYEITVSNLGDSDTVIELRDYTQLLGDAGMVGTLTSVNCVSTIGTASCFEILHANIGIPQDGEPENGNFDVFWEILPEDNWELPAQSSVTFEVVINWEPQCSQTDIIAVNNVEVHHVGDVIDSNNSNNSASVTTYFAPCVDLIVQTFPQFTQVNINQNFDWIIDISNSTTSSDAVDVFFEDTLDSVFTITGTPTCQITSGNATCISTFNVTGNTITGTIPVLDTGSTVRIRIPVSAPNFGGAFNNTAEATPSEINNEELTPETNISLSNVQVIAPILTKSFNPDTIVEGQESTLTFTITNISSNAAQTNITFTDNLPSGVFLSSTAGWIEDNGCTANFVGIVGDDFVGVTNLTFPEGVATCTFSVQVTSNITGVYLNNFENFSNQNNIDTSQAQATLTVIEDTSNVDIEVLKTVNPTQASIGDDVVFTITISNLGTTTATGVEIYDNLPLGYEFISASTTNGFYDVSTTLWSVLSLNSNASETLTINARVISSENLLNIAMLNSVDQPDRDDTNNEDSASVEVDNCLQIPQGISPNNDSDNDFLVIPCIEDYPNNTIKIYNRLGVLVFQDKDYKNNWDGKPNMGFPQTRNLLPVGTYFYILDLNNGIKPIQGWVYLSY